MWEMWSLTFVTVPSVLAISPVLVVVRLVFVAYDVPLLVAIRTPALLPRLTSFETVAPQPFTADGPIRTLAPPVRVPRLAMLVPPLNLVVRVSPDVLRLVTLPPAVAIMPGLTTKETVLVPETLTRTANLTLFVVLSETTIPLALGAP